MRLIESDDNFGKVSSMQQIGFGFPSDEPCLHMAISPNSCLAVALASDGTARLKMMQYRSGTPAASADDPSFAATVVAFALQFAYSCTNLSNNDDILAVIQQYPALTLEHEILNEIYRVLGVNVDYSGDPQQEKLFRNPMIRGCLSMQASFGFRGAHKHQSVIAKIASTTLNLRLASLTFTFMFNNVSRPSAGSAAESDFTKPDVFQSLLGIVTWSVDLMNYIIDELYSLAELVKGHWDDKDFIAQKIQALNSPALPLVMISASRTFLKYNCRGLRGLGTTAHRTFQVHAQGDTLQSFKSLEDVIDRSPIEVHQFEKILADIEGKIKKTYSHHSGGGGISDADRARVEKEMLIGADIPDVLMPVVQHLLTTALDNLRKDIDPAALYFADHSWLGLSDDRRSDAYKREHVVDAIRKVPLRKGAKVRRCTRCCAYMEDVLPQKGSSMWMTSMQRMCFCGSLWMLVGKGDRLDVN
ncbi:MAG: mediator complex subunit [Pleopsidium flavum]|nr:MAG: mediator complex subunit [Pleopsidium flavum]